MRVEGTGRIGQGAYQTRSRVNGSGFALPDAESPALAQKASGPLAAPALDALLALQSVETSGERRRRAAARGRSLLEALDRMKLGVLDGSLCSDTLDSLREMLSAGREASGEEGLDAILGEIELRAEVELAKLRHRQT